MGRSIAFVQPRGGAGKSTTVVQLAASIAEANPESTVIVVDASVHADATHMLMGGFQEPETTEGGFTTRGAELAAEHKDKTFSVLLQDLARATTTTLWRHVEPEVDVTARSLSVCEVHPQGGAPPNLRLVCGGGGGTGDAHKNVQRIGTALGAAMGRAPEGTIFLLDMDAEAAERHMSAVAVLAASELALVTTANWSEFLRCVTDPHNGLALSAAGKKIKHVVFTKVEKTRNEECALEGVTCLGFKPLNASLENVSTITAYAYARANSTTSVLYNMLDASGSLQDFVSAHVLALPSLPETVLNHSVMTATPIAGMQPAPGVAADALAAAKQQIAFAARRLVV